MGTATSVVAQEVDSQRVMISMFRISVGMDDESHDSTSGITSLEMETVIRTFALLIRSTRTSC